MDGTVDGIEELRAANQAFYDAFEARDMDRMSDVWEHSDRVVCTHPGWKTLRGWGPVAASFFALFQQATATQFILTNEALALQGDVGWVSVDENVLGTQTGTVAGLNVFARDAGGRWRMVCHAGSVVIRDSPGVL